MPVIDPISPSATPPIEEGPCNWTVDTSCCPDWATLPPQAQSNGIAWATYILWSLTGRRYGPCSVTVRPCGRRCEGWGGYMTYPVDSQSATGFPGAWMTPFVDGSGTWRNCVCPGACSCEASCQVLLPGPVAVVDEVMVDGVVLDPSAYRLDNGNILVRIDGEECWPECQDMDLANDAVGAFAVTYQRGVAVPRAGQIAAGELACEFAKACAGGECQLPGQLASLSRQGVDVQMVDPSTFLDEGLTGIANVDLWIRSVNPARLAQRPRVYSGDVNRPRFVS